MAWPPAYRGARFHLDQLGALPRAGGVACLPRQAAVDREDHVFQRTALSLAADDENGRVLGLRSGSVMGVGESASHSRALTSSTAAAIALRFDQAPDGASGVQVLDCTM